MSLRVTYKCVLADFLSQLPSNAPKMEFIDVYFRKISRFVPIVVEVPSQWIFPKMRYCEISKEMSSLYFELAVFRLFEARVQEFDTRPLSQYSPTVREQSS